MDKTESTTSLTQAEINSLNGMYKSFIERLRKKWLRHNNHPLKPRRLYELDAEERQRVDGVIRAWERYVTPIAEKWWGQRGFGIRWPEKSSDPCQIYRLEVTPTLPNRNHSC